MDAVLFDMDGVIVNSEDYWHEFEDETLFPTVVAGEPPENDEITGMNYREIYDYLAANYETTIEKAEFVDLYDRTAQGIYGEKVVLMDEFRSLCEDLRDRGATLGLVSSAPRDWIEIVIDRFELGHFDLVMSAEEIDDPGKPRPHVYRHAASVLGVDPEDCIVVEDSTNGALSAARAGAHVIGYRTETNAETDLSAADVVAEGPRELRVELLG
jgi:HAD superfamily hydrolase (TIGR01509 family)